MDDEVDRRIDRARALRIGTSRAHPFDVESFAMQKSLIESGRDDVQVFAFLPCAQNRHTAYIACTSNHNQFTANAVLQHRYEIMVGKAEAGRRVFL